MKIVEPYIIINSPGCVTLTLSASAPASIVPTETGVPTAKPVAFEADSMMWPANSWLHISSGS